MATTMMADFPTNMPVFLTPSQQEHLNKLRMSASATGINNNWENDISAFLMNNTDQLDFSNVPSSSPIDNNDMGYYPNSSPETFVSPDASPYRSDNSQISSPFDPALFNNSPVQEIYSPPQMYTPPQPDMYNSSPHNEYSAPIDVDPSLFEACNLTNPLLMPEIEKILAATPAFQPTSSAPIEIPSIETASKKRAREFDFNANVTLSRDQLLAMSSKEIEDYVSVVKTKRTLTAAEEKDLKKQRRLVKNREYASQSRSRKKQYVDEIEKQLEQARAETDAYKKQNQMLIEENKILKKQLGHIAETIKKSQHGANMRQQQHIHPSNLVSSTPGMFTQFTTIGGGRHSMLPSKTASACVFVILFMVCTFATFWDNEPLGITLFPNQNNGGHIFNKRRLLEFELEDIVGLNPDFSPFSSLSLSSSHSHSDPNIQHKSNSSPDSSLPSSFSSSSSSSSSLSSSSSYSTNLCYPHVYDSSVNASAWCSQDEHNNIIIL